jgi:hypothetical protein
MTSVTIAARVESRSVWFCPETGITTDVGISARDSADEIAPLPAVRNAADPMPGRPPVHPVREGEID